REWREGSIRACLRQSAACLRQLAAVDGWGAGVLALDDVNDVFCDVGGVIADPFEGFCDKNELERGGDDAGNTHHVGEKLAEDLVAVVIDLVIHRKDFLRKLNIATNHGI